MSKISKAIGPRATNIKKLREVLGKKIRVVGMPPREDKEEITRFIGSVVEPVDFNRVEIKDSLITISAGRQSKAALIGRNRVREKELSEVMKNFFNIPKLRIA